MKRLATLVASLGSLLVLAHAAAFSWQPNQLPPGNHRYVLELSSGAENAAPPVQMTLEYTQTDTGYDAKTTYVSERLGVSAEELSADLLGTSSVGMMALGPMALYGPMFMMLPMLLGEEDIKVRSEPMIVMGMGKLYMDKTEEVAGLECVVLRFESNDENSEAFEFALAENIPFPCFSRYGNGDGTFTEMRLLEVQQP